MYTTKESFFIKDQLVFKLRFPKRGEKHSFCLVLEVPDCERKMAQIHTNLLHRGYIFLNAAYNVMFYTPGSVRIAYETVSRCPVCQQFRPRRKLKIERLNISTAKTVWGIDHKGPQMLKGKPVYVFVAVELNFRLVSFSLAKTTNAAETAKLLFEQVFCVYGGAVEIVSDRSKSFQNELFTNLLQLGNVRHHVTSSYSPWANARD